MSRLRLINVALIAFTTAVSLATVATAAVALSGCSSADRAEASDGGTNGQNVIRGTNVFGGDGGAVDIASVQVITLTASGPNAATPSLCATGTQSYSYTPSIALLEYDLCPATGPFAGTSEIGTFTLSAADNAAFLAKLQAMTAWPTSTAACDAAPPIGYSAILEPASGDSLQQAALFDSAVDCGDGDETELAVQAGGIEAAYDTAAAFTAAYLATLQKGGTPVVTDATVEIDLSAINDVDLDNDSSAACSKGDDRFHYVLGTNELEAFVCQASGPGGSYQSDELDVQLSSANVAAITAALRAITLAPLGSFCPSPHAVQTLLVDDGDADGGASGGDYTGCDGAATATSVLDVSASWQVFESVLPIARADGGADAGLDGAAGN